MRVLRASGLAACLALAAVSNTSAASSGFTGAWESIDTDGSYQVMSISGVGASGRITRLAVFDSFGTVCVNVGAVSTTFHGLADVSIDGNDLWFTWRHVGCGD